MSVNFKSEEEAKEYVKNLGIEYRFGCFKEKKTEVCHLLGDYLEAVDRNYEKAWKVYKDNCDTSNHPRSCLKCGNYVAMGKGGQKEDKVQALQYFEKSCRLGEASGCFRAGIMAAVLSNTTNSAVTFKQAISYLEKGCEGRNNEACYHLSGIYLDGFEKGKIAKDMKRSFEYATKACDLNNMYACANLSLMYKRGEGVEKNEELAEKLKVKAQRIQDDMIKQRELSFQAGLNRT
ncbi:cytochrome c oxidase assembly factor 7 homolog [Macrosteles quadrilineatus]|uniref:cytochrome c oxidase assembly factor 7 homolog n=1 Tax=Macrosteles quadrilineatus TaxID=74068 RepID=UPI0023E1FD7F|nr:cytochrome c oxidase assembly factor 7 homolog [Macrosteles quadrilineatus]